MSNRYKILISVVALALLSILLLNMLGYKIPLINGKEKASDHSGHLPKPIFDAEGEIEYWTCAMHPSVRLPDKDNCPICGMDTVPVMKKSSNDSKAAQTKNQHDHSTMQPQKTNGSDSVFNVSPERQQLIGVKTSPVEMRNLEKIIRTTGKVELDETRIEHVHTKISGWIDNVFVDYKWQYVNKGEPLFSIYSPELLSTQEEYLLALRSKDILSQSEFPEVSSGANSMLEAAKRRLRLWDISNSQIRELERTGKVKKSLVIHSPISGNIVERNAFPNMYVEPNTSIYTIADHSSVWVNVDIYENEIHLINKGDKAKMTLDALPGETLTGTVEFIWPHLDPVSRTIKVRLEFPNPDTKLLPEMYTNIEIDIPLGTQLSVPKSSVLRTGAKDIVFVDKGNGNIEIRKIMIGRAAGGYYEVTGGLSEGERVISRANFLIDSESKVQAAVAAWKEESNEEMQMEQDTADKLPDHSHIH